jgi:multidrug resistance efflux pump
MKKQLLFLLSLSLLTIHLSCSNQAETKNEKAEKTTKPLTTNDRILGVARIEPVDGLINITAGTNGKILAVLVDENQSVSKGQALLNVEMAIESAQLNQAQSKINAQQAAIEANKANIATLKVNLQNAQDNYNRNLQLYEGKAQTKENLDNSLNTLERIKKEIEVAEANFRQSGAKMNELQADINYYQTILNQKQIASPVAGKILSVSVKVGEYVNNTTQIAEFAPLGNLIAKTEVDELFAEKIKIGQKAQILSQTTGEKLAEGTVSFAADYLKSKSLFKDQSTEQEDRRVREVHIKLESGKMPLIGSRVDCLIFLK